jgi:thiol-disulfide isomerase/thioredoxin
MEFKFLLMTVSWGDTNKQAGLETAATSLLHDTALSEEDHVALLGAVAKTSAPEKARPWLQAAVRNAPSPKVKAAAEEQLKRFDGLGKPVELQFTAVDGRAVDLARFKGKVVLIDFWATWCPPCVAAIPEVKKIYDEFHPKGFEIVGINLDKDKSKLTQFVADNKMEWPQFFDGLFWQNKYARQFGIESIPTLWLIDKRGALRDLDALTRLSGEVPKLLAE